MKLWPWALHAYARPGVQEACLALQDRHGQSIPYLLWAAWTAREGLALPPGALAQAASLAACWEAAAVSPLRQARRGLKPALAGIADTAREQLRGEVKALELRAEEMLMRALEPIASEPAGVPRPLPEALEAAAAAWTSAAPESALRRLAGALD